MLDKISIHVNTSHALRLVHADVLALLGYTCENMRLNPVASICRVGRQLTCNSTVVETNHGSTSLTL